VGRQAKLTAARRAERARLKESLRAAADAVEGSAELAAELAAFTDEETRAMVDRDAPGQRQRLEAHGWRRTQPSTDGLGVWDHRKYRLRIIHSVARERDGQIWAHTSLSHERDYLPDWYRLRDVQWMLYPAHPGIVIIAPPDRHYSVAEVMHTWTCLTKADVLPDFRHLGGV